VGKPMKKASNGGTFLRTKRLPGDDADDGGKLPTPIQITH
jgi:hypothetical protein